MADLTEAHIDSWEKFLRELPEWKPAGCLTLCQMARRSLTPPEDGGITQALVGMARENAIEECAQVADEFNDPEWVENIVAAIRALKEVTTPR